MLFKDFWYMKLNLRQKYIIDKEAKGPPPLDANYAKAYRI